MCDRPVINASHVPQFTYVPCPGCGDAVPVHDVCLPEPQRTYAAFTRKLLAARLN